MAKVWIALMSKMIYNLIDLASWVGLNSPFFVKDWESCFLPRMNSYEQLEALSPPCFVYMETAKMKYLDSVVLFFKWISFIYSYMYSLCDFVFFFPIATLSIFSGFNSFKGSLSYSCKSCAKDLHQKPFVQHWRCHPCWTWPRCDCSWWGAWAECQYGSLAWLVAWMKNCCWKNWNSWKTSYKRWHLSNGWWGYYILTAVCFSYYKYRDCIGPQATEKTPAKETTLLTEGSIEIVKPVSQFCMESKRC